MDDGDLRSVEDANQRFYQALSTGSIDGISAVCAHDDDVSVLHEDSKEVAVGWPAVLETWKAVPFDLFADLSVVMEQPVIRVSGDLAWVTGLEQVSGRMKHGGPFAWIALGTNIFRRRGGEWLMVHHHASKGSAELPAVAEALATKS